MTKNIINAPVLSSKKGVAREEAPVSSYGSLDLGSDMFFQGRRVYEAGIKLTTAVLGITTNKKQPRSPHMAIIDLMGRA